MRRKKEFTEQDFLSWGCIAAFSLGIISLLAVLAYDANKNNQLKPEEVTAVSSYRQDDYDAGECIHPKTNCKVTIRALSNESEINVRQVPALVNDSLSATIDVGTEFYPTIYYRSGDYFGFPDEELGIFDEKDNDGVLWISKLYLLIEQWDDTSVFDDGSYKKNIWFGDGKYKIVVKETTNLRCAPMSGRNYSYGMLKPCEFDVDMVFKDINNKYAGFSSDGFDEELERKFGSIEDDPDGILWVAIENIEVYQR